MPDLSGGNRPIDQVKRVSWALGPQCPSVLVRESTYPLYLLVTVSWRHTLGHSYLEFALPTARRGQQRPGRTNRRQEAHDGAGIHHRSSRRVQQLTSEPSGITGLDLKAEI
jgi:hypothetical protein